MVHDRERLTFGLEPCDHLGGVHAKLNNLERDLAPHRGVLIGQPHDAAAALPNFANQGERPELVARSFFGVGRRSDSKGSLKKLARVFVRREQLLDTDAQRLIAGAGVIEPRGAFGYGQFDRFGENFCGTIHGVRCGGGRGDSRDIMRNLGAQRASASRLTPVQIIGRGGASPR